MLLFLFFFFFKQKTAYEMRTSDWSSDVCSSDLDFREAREAEKYELCAEFGATLPRLRKRVAQDLRHRRMDKARAVAAVVRLLDLGFVRVGSECYVTANKSYGATPLRKRPADADGRVLKLE